MWECGHRKSSEKIIQKTLQSDLEYVLQEK